MTETTPSRTPTTGGQLIWRTLRRQRRSVLGAVALLTLWQVCEATVPVLIGVIIDQAVATEDVGRLVLWIAVLTVHFAVLSFAYRFGSRLGFRGVLVEGHRLRTEVSGHVLAPRGVRTTRLPGEVLSIATSDADEVGSVIEQVGLTGAALAGLAVSGAALAVIDPLLAVVVLGGVPLVLVCTQVLAPRLAHRSEARQESLGLAIGQATDLVRGLRPLKGIGAEDVALARYREQSRAAMTASIAAARWEGLLYGVTAAISGAFLAGVALLAGVRALEGQLSIGELVAVVGLAQFVAEPMGLIAYLVAQVARSQASAARVVGVLNSPALVEGGDRDATDLAELSFDGVTHGSLRDLTFTAAPGSLVAVSTEDPSDAAAVMALLRGEVEPEAGAVRLGGVPLGELQIEQSRARLLVTEHHVDLFEGTMRSNLDPADEVPSDRMTQVLEASAVADVVAGGAAGLDAPVAVDGATLSGGQRQRVGLARALAADAPVLVLHDPTTAVDAATEQRIATGLRGVRHGGGVVRTTVVLTSSPALLAGADLVVHLRDGRLVGQGTHAELTADAGYRDAVLR